MQNKVELLGFYGSDEVIACSAWTSTSRELTEQKRQRIPNLINMLWMDGHETPFEKAFVHFLVDCDIASHIHLLKHRMSSLNAESARYKELKEDKIYLPEDWKGIKISEGDVNEFFYDNDGNINSWYEVLEDYTTLGNQLYHKCLEDLTPVLGRKRAKESARYFKTYNSVITTDVIMNMSCFDNFYKLRHSDKAQKEIYDIAGEMAAIIENIEGNPFKTTIKLIKNES